MRNNYIFGSKSLHFFRGKCIPQWHDPWQKYANCKKRHLNLFWIKIPEIYRTWYNDCCVTTLTPLVASTTLYICITALWPGDTIWRQGSESSLAPVMAWCRQAAMLTYDQRGFVAFTREQFHRKKTLRYLSLKWVWSLQVLDCSRIPQGPMS